MSKLHIFLLTLLTIILLTSILNVIDSYRDFPKVSKEDPENYVRLLDGKIKSKLIESITLKGYHPVSSYRVGKKDRLSIFKIGKVSAVDIDTIIRQSYIDSYFAFYNSTKIDLGPIFKTGYNFYQAPINLISLNIYGSSVIKLKKDSLIYFRSTLKAFNICFNDTSTVSVCGEHALDNEASSISKENVVEIIFLKQAGYLYLLLGYQSPPGNSNDQPFLVKLVE